MHHQQLRPAALAVCLIASGVLGPGPSADRALAADRKGARPIAEFEVAPDGDFLFLPVIIGQHEYRFLLSTGLSATIIDTELRQKLDLAELPGTPDSIRRGKTRYRLQARLGARDLDLSAGVETGDYSTMSRELGLTLDGELGLDALRGQILQLDFDRGAIRFLPAVPAGAGDLIRIQQPGQESGVPTVALTIPGHKPVRFIVSTGRLGNSLDIDNRLLASLDEPADYRLLSHEKGYSRSGTATFPCVRLTEIQVGSFHHEGIIANCGEGNGVGLGYLSRYLVTMDLARGRMFLKKRANFDLPDSRLDLGQVDLLRDEHAVTITRVHPHGPAARLGLQPGDVLETLNGHPVARHTTWHLRRALGRPDAPLTATVRRDQEPVDMNWRPDEAGETERKPASR